MSIKKFFSYVVLFASVLSILLTSACGQATLEVTEPGVEDNSEAGEEAEVEETEVAVNPYEDIVINYGLTTAWDTLNPYGPSFSGSLYSFLTLDKIYDRLAYIENGGQIIRARGAESWEQSEDGLSAIFHLDPDAKFHDGEPVTADDWVFTLQLITDPELTPVVRSEFNLLAGTDDTGTEVSENSVGATAIDDYTLEIQFKNVIPVEDFLLLKNRFLYVLPEHILSEIPVAEITNSDFWMAPIGSGPCTFISEIIGSKLELGSFSEYHLGAPKFDKLVLTVVSATNTITGVVAGELDYFFGGPSVDDAKLAESLGLTVMKSPVPQGLTSIIINNQNVSEKLVRHAIDLAVDKDLILEQNTQGEGTVAAMYILPSSKYANPDITWERDVEGAKALLAEAGWDPDRVLTMAVSSRRESLAALIQQNLAEAGLQIEVQIVDTGTMFSGLADGTYDLGICGSGANEYPLWMEGYYDYRNATYAQITDTRFAEMQAEIASELDPDVRMQLVLDYQEFMHDEMPLVYMFFSYSFAVTSPRLTGINPFASNMYNDAVWEWEVVD